MSTAVRLHFTNNGKRYRFDLEVEEELKKDFTDIKLERIGKSIETLPNELEVLLSKWD